ncbi:hypothetical protein L873DRAFT_1848011 [Choiromyces venosus 120613-1]|uniref:Uncharacterized protein n=1 Tax=Choiromyces venosus 120613-1 TaxID=1336337 RepID=A0A3N4J0K1_9PEZI|nr:hypothetical protein L873DRAFT_1848011 [Choiromyces venosus 120613-1]
MQLLQATCKNPLIMQIPILASLVASSTISSMSPFLSPTPIPTPTAIAGGTCVEIAPGETATLPIPDSLKLGYYNCATTATSPPTSDIITIAKHILTDGYVAPIVAPGKQCGELAKQGEAVFYICGEYLTGGQDDAVVVGVTSILDHCEMGGKAEGVFRVSEGGLLVITSVGGGLVVDGALRGE